MGGVCGNMNPRDSMACCKHAKFQTTGAPVTSLSSCCSHCKMDDAGSTADAGKILVPRTVRSAVPAYASAPVVRLSFYLPQAQRGDSLIFQKSPALSPKVYLLTETLLI